MGSSKGIDNEYENFGLDIWYVDIYIIHNYFWWSSDTH